MRQNAEKTPQKAAIVFKDQTTDWQELWKQVQAASAGLSEYLDGEEQKVVALLLPNSSDFIIAYLAILHTGHIAFPIDPAYKQLEFDAIIEQIPSELIITSDKYRGQIGEHHEPVVKLEDLQNNPQSSINELRLPVDKQIASLTFTSGTTGKPKAVPNTHANHIWNIEVCSEVWKWTSDDTILISLPLSHWYGIVMGISGSLFHSSTLYLQDWFDEVETLKALSSGKITFYQHISQAYQRLVQVDDGDYDLSNVRLCVSGGAPLPPDVWRKFKDRFGIEILETYGSSETGRIAANRMGEPPKTGSPGKILPGVDMRLGEDNEVQVKSAGVFPGYYHNPAVTKAAYTSDGYYRTGDIGEIKNGYLHLKGRKQEQIRRFGYTISPRDVEWAMHQNQKVKDIYVMGHQADSSNDELVYFIVGDISEDEVKDYCKANLIFAWRPDKIVFMDNLPRTNSGKPRVAEFKHLVEQGV